MESEFCVQSADRTHLHWAGLICQTIRQSVLERGTGIAGRTSRDIREKIKAGKAIVATHANGEWAGFAYWELWENGQFVSHSGMIVNPIYRHHGVAGLLKQRLLSITRSLFPGARTVSITTTEAVMNLNTKAGFHPVPFAKLPHDDRFWSSCASCQHHDILDRTERKFCLCTGMRLDPDDHPEAETAPEQAAADAL